MVIRRLESEAAVARAAAGDKVSTQALKCNNAIKAGRLRGQMCRRLPEFRLRCVRQCCYSKLAKGMSFLSECKDVFAVDCQLCGRLQQSTQLR